MKTGYFIVEGKECYFEIIEMLEQEVKCALIRKIAGGVLFFIEKFSLINTSDLLIVLRVQKHGSEDKCEIEIVAGGGGDGFMSLTFGNERRKINGLVTLISDFCKSKRFMMSEPRSGNPPF